MKSLFALCLGVLSLCMVIPGEVLAQEAAITDPARQEAKALFEEAQSLYTKDQFKDAAEKFLAAFDKKPFSSFLFNAAVAFEKGKQLDKAIEQFQRYLAFDPQATDGAEVKARIDSLRAILSPPPPPVVEGQPVPEKPVVAAPVLPTIETKGFIIIDTKPAGATIYLDDKTKGVFATTPWQGSLPPKPVKVLVEARGFKPEERQIFPRVDKVLELYIALSEQHFLGWVEVVSNVPGADVYIDQKEIGAIGKTPYTGHLKPGKHKLWVQKLGYEASEREIVVEPGTANLHKVDLEAVSFGLLRAGTKTSQGAKLFVDGAEACTMPCEQKLTAGDHTIRVQKEAMEKFEGPLKVDRADDTFMDLTYSPKPSRVPAWTYGVLSAGFLAGGIYLGMEGNKIKDQINKDAVDPSKFMRGDDSRKTKGKIYYVAADVCFGASLVTGLLSLWNFLESGPPSVATFKTQNGTKAPTNRLGLLPMDIPNGAGLTATGRF